MPNAQRIAVVPAPDRLVDGLTAMTVAHSAGTGQRRSVGETRMARGARTIAEIAERLSAIMNFGALEERDLYTIGQLSDYLQVSLRTLRFYEQAGLLRPVREGTKRLYTRQDLDQLKVIVTLRELEASLTAIKSLMTSLQTEGDIGKAIASIEGLLVAITSSNHERIAELTRLNRRTDRVIACLATRN